MRLDGLSGVGLSTPHLYETVADFVPDLVLVADQLGIDRFSTVGLSGGAPYAMAAAAHQRALNYTWAFTAARLRRLYADLATRQLVSC